MNHSRGTRIGIHPEGIHIINHPGGMPAISRGLREFRAPPPVPRARNPSDPGGIADQQTIHNIIPPLRPIWHPFRMRVLFTFVTGGIVALLLNHRLLPSKPLASKNILLECISSTSFFHGFEASGFIRHPGGMPAISRGLHECATPGINRYDTESTPAGVAAGLIKISCIIFNFGLF